MYIPLTGLQLILNHPVYVEIFVNQIFLLPIFENYSGIPWSGFGINQINFSSLKCEAHVFFSHILVGTYMNTFDGMIVALSNVFKFS